MSRNLRRHAEWSRITLRVNKPLFTRQDAGFPLLFKASDPIITLLLALALYLSQLERRGVPFLTASRLYRIEYLWLQCRGSCLDPHDHLWSF